MKAADWNTLYRIGLGVSILLFLFSTILIIFQSFFIVGLGGYGELGLSGFIVCMIFFYYSYLVIKCSKKRRNLSKR